MKINNLFTKQSNANPDPNAEVILEAELKAPDKVLLNRLPAPYIYEYIYFYFHNSHSTF